MDYKISDASGYVHARPSRARHYILPPVLETLEHHFMGAEERDVFELGCGTGDIAAELTAQGYRVHAVDPSLDGIRQAKIKYPHVSFALGSTYDDLPTRFGTFKAVISIEVIEHIYDPRAFMNSIYSLLDADGIVILSTPFHGYTKNLMLALTGRLDSHFGALKDHGHIKFWSEKTLTRLLEETGFRDIRYRHAGRLRPIAKSMIAIAKK